MPCSPLIRLNRANRRDLFMCMSAISYAALPKQHQSLIWCECQELKAIYFDTKEDLAGMVHDIYEPGDGDGTMSGSTKYLIFTQIDWNRGALSDNGMIVSSAYTTTLLIVCSSLPLWEEAPDKIVKP
ncbi:hypothetical protein B0T13DRAFT_475802 [Neurospora crassa]|nr:hypothetical protein B0T13DRAFT_475802 [Neurospora crassa]